MFPNSQNSAIEKNYIYLWFFDVFLAIPIIILIYFLDKIRRIILILILISALIFFFFEFGFNSVYFNTFIALFLANRMLLFNLSPEEKKNLITSRTKRFLLVFPVSFIVTVTESILDKMGILHHEKVGDGLLMSTAGKIFLFVGYYSIVAYLEYRKVKYPNSKFFV
jgi:peptidoglycan/LPS O-acetylase OafA/YrhL